MTKMIKMKEIRVRMAADSHVKMRYDLHSRRKQTDKIKEQAKETTKIEPLIKAGCRIWRLFLNLTRDASRRRETGQDSRPRQTVSNFHGLLFCTSVSWQNF